MTASLSVMHTTGATRAWAQCTCGGDSMIRPRRALESATTQDLLFLPAVGLLLLALVLPTEALVTRTIAASAGPGGLISPAGAVVVVQGSSKKFLITPNGYARIQD